MPVFVRTDCWFTVEATSNAVRGLPRGWLTCGLNCDRLACNSESSLDDTEDAASIAPPTPLKFIGSKLDFQIVNGPMLTIESGVADPVCWLRRCNEAITNALSTSELVSRSLVHKNWNIRTPTPLIEWYVPSPRSSMNGHRTWFQSLYLRTLRYRKPKSWSRLTQTSVIPPSLLSLLGNSLKNNRATLMT